jgi:hypothetical protein
VRRDNVPAIEEDGNLADIQLTSRQNVAEETHVLFLPRNVVGVLYNHEGPRISRLVEYLRDRFGILVSISPVLDSATARRLAKMGTFTSVEMTIPVSRANLLSEDPAEVAVAVRQMAAASLSRTVHVKAVIQGTPGQRRWRNWVEDVVRSPRLEAFTKLKVHSRKSDLGDPPQTVDFVKEQLVMREAVHMQANRSRRVQPSSAKAAIRNAYAHLETQIGDAVAPVGDVDLTIEDLT